MKNILFCTLFILMVINLTAQNYRWDNQFISTNAPDDTVFAICKTGNNVFIGGAFMNVAGSAVNHVAQFDGTSWSSLGSGINGNVYDIAHYNSYIIAGGNFTQAGGVSTANLAYWDGTTWNSLASSCNGTIRTLLVFEQYLYVGGDFTSINGVSANHIARYNGTLWEALGTGTDGPVYTIHQSTFLYIGGDFSTAGGNNVNNFARWNGTDWQTYGNGFDAPVYSITGSGIQITVGGNFIQSGSTVLNHIAKWDGIQWLDLNAGTNGNIRKIKQVGTDYYICGNFTTAGTTNTNNIAQWNGSSWLSLGDGLNQEGFCLSNNGYDLLCGGKFTTAGLLPSNYFGRYYSPPVITAQSGVITKCEGDSLILIVNAESNLSLTYQWEKDSSPLSINNDTLIIFPSQPSDAGNYLCTVTNSAGSTVSANIIVNVFQLPVFSISQTDTAICEGLPINLVVNGTGTNPITLQWYNNSGIISGQTNDTLSFPSASLSNTGNYWCIASNMCSNDTSFFNLTIYPNPVASFTGLSNEYCINDSGVILIGSPLGGIFTGNGLNDSLFSPAGLVGNHTITYTYTDNNGCVGVSSQSTIVHTLTFVTFSGLNANYCFNSSSDTLHGIPAGGIYYGIGMNDSIFNPNMPSPGNNTVYYAYTDLNGCTNTKSLSTFIYSPQIFSYTSLDTTLCENDNSITINVNPTGGSFSGTGISGNDFDPQVTGIGNFQVLYQYTDANSCNNTDSLNFTVSSLPVVTISSVSAEYCINGPIDTIVGNPVGGIFSGSNITDEYLNPSLFGAGNYSVYYSYTDVNGCTNTDTASFDIINVATIFFSGINTYYCPTESPDTLTGTPAGGIFSGNGIIGNIFYPSFAQSGTNPVIYTYDNLNGCFSYDSVMVTVAPLPLLNIGQDISICLGDSILLTATGDTGTYYWNTAESTQSISVAPISSTNYFVMLYSGICYNSDTIQITVNPLPVLDLGPDSVACPPFSISVSDDYYSYLWSTGSTDTLISISANGDYFLTVTNVFGCDASDQVNITLMPVPQIDLGTDKTISGLQSIIIGVSPNYSNYTWSNGSHQNFIVVDGSDLGEGTFPFWLTALNSFGCSASDTILIQVLGDVYVQENNLSENITIYPNPASEFIHIESGFTNNPDYTISLITVTGKTIFEITNKELSKTQYNISLAGIPKGIYLIKIYGNNILIHKRIIVK